MTTKYENTSRSLFDKLSFFSVEARRRLRQHGLQSAYIYTKCAVVNGAIRIGNRLGLRRVECPCCGWRGFDFRMLDCNDFAVPGVICPSCHNQERHRMVFLFFHRFERDFFDRKGTLLHFAPENYIDSVLRENKDIEIVGTDYFRSMVAEFVGPRALTDMQSIGFAANSFDFICCVHVLEHVLDDRKGIAELYRILKPGGVAYIMVPFMLGWPKTVEFGWNDPTKFFHARGYSPADFKERLAPFSYEEIKPDTFLTREEIVRYRIPNESQMIYRCVKPVDN